MPQDVYAKEQWTQAGQRNSSLAQGGSSVSLTDQIGGMINRASETYSLLSAQYERLFGPLPARPESIGHKMTGPPSISDAITSLYDYLDRIEYVSRRLAERV